MLPLAHRLSKKEIEEVFRKGRPFFIAELGMRLQKNTTHTTKFSCICSKKFLPGAVQRNEFKRRVRSALRSLQKKWPEGYNIVIIATRQSVGLKKIALEGIIEQCFKKIL